MAITATLETAEESDAFLSALKRAVRERCTVAAYATSKTYSNWESFACSGLATRWTYVNNIVETVRALGSAFIDTTCEYDSGDDTNTYAVGSYCNFPKTLAYRMRKDKRHSINADRISRLDSWDVDSIDEYRQILANCAYWLNQMTVVEVPSWYARHYADANGFVYWDDFSGEAPTSEGDYPTSCISAYPAAKQGYPSIHLEWREFSDNSGGDDWPSTPTETAGYKSCNSTYGCSILNATPYSAECNLYFMHNWAVEQNRDSPWHQLHQHPYLQFDRFYCSDYFPVRDEDWPSTFTRQAGFWGLVNGEVFQFETTATTGHTYTSAESPEHYGTGKDGSGTAVGYVCSINAARTASAYYETIDATPGYWYSWGDNDLWVNYFPIIPLGGVEVGQPSFSETIPAHSEKMLWTAPEEVWEPDYFEGYSQFGITFDRGSYEWNEDWNSQIDMRCVATLDFSDSFTMVQA